MSKAIGLDGLRLSVQALMHQIRKKADKDEVVSSINGQTGDVQIDLDPEGKAIPDYVKKEADRVIKEALASTGDERGFVLAVITDMHYGNGGYADGVKHACQALKYIDQRIKLDAVAVLGDYTDAYNAGLNPQAEADFRAVNALLDDLRFAPNLRLHGNHDFCSEWGDWASERTFRCVEAYSDDVVRGNGSYFYRDFEWHKLRIICLDTVGDSAGNVSCTAEQAQWFAEALDLSAKPDEVGWRVLVLSHHPVDFYRVEQQPGYFVEIIDAYVKGGAYNVGGVSGDFAGKGCDVDPFRFVGNIHGHIHNLLVDRICANSYDGRASIDALRIATPEACYGRNNHYDERWTEDVSYDKIQNTAKDTSFVLYCINPGSGVVYAHCYGAGRNREIYYYKDNLQVDGIPVGDASGGDDNGDESAYTNQIPIAIDQNGNTVTDGAMYTDSRWSSSGSVSAQEGYFISGLIPAKPGDFVRVRWNNTEKYGDTGYQGVRAFGADRTPIDQRLSFMYMFDPSNEAGAEFTAQDGFYYDREAGVLDFKVIAYSSIPYNTEYLTFTLTGSPSDVIITVNEEIV